MTSHKHPHKKTFVQGGGHIPPIPSVNKSHRYQSPEETRWVTLAQISGELNRTPVQTKKLLVKLGYIGMKVRQGSYPKMTVYDVKTLEVIKALLGIPHRHISDTKDDWLTKWLGEEQDGSS